MAETFDMVAHLASSTVRFGWYWSINWLLSREARRYAGPPPYKPTRPVPSDVELMANLRGLLLDDAHAVRDGIYPPMAGPVESFTAHLSRVRDMFEDLPDSIRRRHAKEIRGAATLAVCEDLPDYFKQDFHYQRGGYLSEDSARLYDVQVETLFYGVAGAMRRSALRPLAAFMKGKDQRKVELLDVACGTGRFLREVRLAYPVIRAKGIDLSAAYLEEARRHLSDLRAVALMRGNAETMPLADASQDIVTTCYLYHELPSDVRRRVTSEIARVLKPGGVFIFIDSLQFGDRTGWDGLVEVFPHRFHEPYYEHYAGDDLVGLFTNARLEVQEAFPVFLSKVMVCRKF